MLLVLMLGLSFPRLAEVTHQDQYPLLTPFMTDGFAKSDRGHDVCMLLFRVVLKVFTATLLYNSNKCGKWKPQGSLRQKRVVLGKIIVIWCGLVALVQLPLLGQSTLAKASARLP